MIRESKTHQIDTVLASSAAEGMLSMDNSLLNLYKEGMISMDTAIYYSFAQENMAKRITQL